MKVPLPAGDVKQYPQLVLRSTESKIPWQIQKGVLFVCLFFYSLIIDSLYTHYLCPTRQLILSEVMPIILAVRHIKGIRNSKWYCVFNMVLFHV